MERWCITGRPCIDYNKVRPKTLETLRIVTYIKPFNNSNNEKNFINCVLRIRGDDWIRPKLQQ